MALPNLIQSTSAVVDLASGELLESVTFHPNGVRETLVSNREVVGFALEPVGFTGKEDDAEVGLVYFGERYLMPHLGRWASADPLQTHGGGGGEFGNSYHYVEGNLLQSRDSLGLWSSRSITVGRVWGRLEPVHQMAIDRVLGHRLDDRSVAILKRMQVAPQRIGPRLQQPTHAMRGRGADLETSIRTANRHVRSNIGEAARLWRAGDREGAMGRLGLAIHTLQDATSPVHQGMQEWTGPKVATLQRKVHRPGEPHVRLSERGIRLPKLGTLQPGPPLRRRSKVRLCGLTTLC